MNCPVCGSAVQPGDTVCRTCGAPLTTSGLVALPAGTTLAGGQYTLSQVLGQGGFGITYAGQDNRLGFKVAIKELFLDGSSRRGKTVMAPGNVSGPEYLSTKKGFLDEAKVLASFNNPRIVRVMNYFEENSTAYLVMEFLEGSTLGGLIEKRGPVPPQVVFEVGRAVAETLEVIHERGLLHRDIKPDNIFFHQSGRIVLIDFGSVRTFVTGKTQSHTRLVTPGYAPLEQYGNSGRFGPYTDIYSLGATLLHALTGQMPPPATDLMLGTPLPPMPPTTPPQLRRAVTQAMALRVEDRPQSARALLAILTSPAADPGAPPVPRAPAAPQPAAQQSGAQNSGPRPPAAPPPAPKPVAVPVQPTAAPRAAPKPSPKPAPPAPRPVPVAPPVVMPAPVVRPTPPVPRSPSPPLPSAAPHQPGPYAPPAGKQKPPVPASRRVLTILGLLLGIRVAAVLAQEMISAPIQGSQYVVAAVVGAGLGGLAGWLLWWVLPVGLPAAAAMAAYFYTEGAGLRWPTVIASTVGAADLAILALVLIRRISL